MMILLSVLSLLLLILLAGRINLSYQFHKEVKTLFAGSNNISQQVFHSNQLSNLPAPVQRYFKHVLKDGQPYISYARIRHDGQFKPGLTKDWVSINGEQYATTDKPGFIWKGTTTMFVARDMYIADKGRLVVSLFSVFPVVDAAGASYDQGELLRWLGESVLYPTNLLPDERLQWVAIDSNTSRLEFRYNRLSLFFTITFNDAGEITEMETKRNMDAKRVETWVIKASNYKEINNVRIPTYFDVLWRLEKGDFSYAKFTIRTVEYDKPEKF